MMFTPINSNFSLIAKNFIPNLFSGFSKENNKIAIVAFTIFSAIATLCLICRCFKAYKFDSDSENPGIPPHITPLNKTLKPQSKTKLDDKKGNLNPIQQLPQSPDLKPIIKVVPKLSDEEFAQLLANEQDDLDFEIAQQLQKEFDEDLKLTLNTATPIIAPLSPPIVEVDVVPTYSLKMDKFSSLSKNNQEMSIQKLTQQQASAVLDIDPTLRTRPAAQGKIFAYNSILIIHEQGVPDRLNAFANHELMKQTQFIIYTISKETNLKKQKELLLELAICVEDCLPVSQGRISLMYMRLASVGKGLDKQIEQFLSGYKDRIVDQIINQLFPDMQKPEYAVKYHSQPSKQFPHMKTGFIALVGKELGLNTTGAAEDPNKNTIDVAIKQNEFKKLFKELVSIQEIIKEFIIDVNGRNGQIDLNDLATWCNPENLGETEAFNVFYDEEFQYPSYSPKYDGKKNVFSPFLTEKSAYLIFEKLGYVQKN